MLAIRNVAFTPMTVELDFATRDGVDEFVRQLHLVAVYGPSFHYMIMVRRIEDNAVG